MELQNLLIDGIEFLESLPESEEITEKLSVWRDQLNQVNTQSTTPTCPKGEYWNGSSCVADIGE